MAIRESHVICKDWIFSILLSGRADDDGELRMRGREDMTGWERGEGMSEVRWNNKCPAGRDRPEITKG